MFWTRILQQVTAFGLVGLAMSQAAFDDSAISDHDDKLLLQRIGDYFTTFAEGDFEGMRDLQADDFRITDIPLSIVRASREEWYNINKAFTSLTKDVKVTALHLHGSSFPGQFALLENAVFFTLRVDPPEEFKAGLPPGIKAGDRAGMIMNSAIWWNWKGEVTRDLEYGMLTWDDFDLDAFREW